MAPLNGGLKAALDDELSVLLDELDDFPAQVEVVDLEGDDQAREGFVVDLLRVLLKLLVVLLPEFFQNFGQILDHKLERFLPRDLVAKFLLLGY